MISLPRQSQCDTVAVDMSTSTSCASERTDSEKDRDSMWDKDRSESRASSSISAATLTNVSGSVILISLKNKQYHIICDYCQIRKFLFTVFTIFF